MYKKKKKREFIIYIYNIYTHYIHEEYSWCIVAKDTFFIIVCYYETEKNLRLGNKKKEWKEKKDRPGYTCFGTSMIGSIVQRVTSEQSLVAEAILLLDYKIVRHSLLSNFFKMVLE